MKKKNKDSAQPNKYSSGTMFGFLFKTISKTEDRGLLTYVFDAIEILLNCVCMMLYCIVTIMYYMINGK